ncbi:hypothetical protein [Fodinibius salsisoli]|uniref:MetA-pathway of phenol degradation n=1 Tax=Fodinibius salsisoli TaxID=2820877 RepID=A0ABT3PNQ8_9BACT|nr:hypothetical protein [Fodinibius salsisoli]MCW9707492.1 hypothetical protein [Fodinibius salsisoli]
MKRFFISTIALLTFVLGLSLSGYSQSVWVPENGAKSKVGLELKIPSFDDRLGFEFPTSSFYLYTHLPLNDHIALQADLPVSQASGGDETRTAIGNPYIGIQSGINSDLKFDLGVRLPLAPEESGIITGFLTENYQIGSFYPNSFSGVADVHYRYDYESGIAIRLDGGGEFWVPEDSDGELFVKYGGQLLYNIDKLTLGTGLAGRLLATDENLSFSERSINSLGLTGTYQFENISAGGYVEIPLNDDTSVFSLGGAFLDVVIGLNLSISL